MEALIEKTFAYHKPSQDGFEKIQALRAAFTEVKQAIEAAAPNSRERATALTRLEEAAMWAIKSVVFNDPASTVDPGR